MVLASSVREHDTGKVLLLDEQSEQPGFQIGLPHLLEFIYLPEPPFPHL